MELTDEIAIICEVLQLNETDLAKKLGISLETINNWKFRRKSIGISNLEKLYSYAYDNGIRLNNAYEQLLKEEYGKDSNVVLFHGAKKQFSLPIDFVANLKASNDFGIGFYLGETFEQAANYIAVLNQNIVYCFCLNLKNLKIYKFNVDTEWMIAIAYYKGWLENYKDTPLINNLVNKLSNYDVIIAPIADNRMFDIIAEFVGSEITDEQCKHALAATNLGFQYVLKTNKSLKNIKLIQETFVCKKEKNKCLDDRVQITSNGSQKVKIARIKFKNKGKYIEEILK